MRDLPRLHEIASVLVRHGFGDLVRRTGVVGALERAGQALNRGSREPTAALTPAQRARLALAELGPSFVKLGQVLATRVDLFPPDWIAEFEHLQSDVPPVPFRDAAAGPGAGAGTLAVRGVPASSTARRWGPPPSPRSTEQRLQDGTAVVIKMVRPGIRPKIDADLRIVAYLAGLLESEIPEARRYQPAQMVAEFARSLRRELDLVQEARAQERFAQSFAGDPGVHGAAHLLGVHARVDERPGARPGHSRLRSGRRRRRRTGPADPGAARRRRRAQDDPGGRLLPRRSASRQRVLPARQPHRDDRFRNGGPAVGAAPPRDRGHAVGAGAARRAGGDRRAARLGARRRRRRGQAGGRRGGRDLRVREGRPQGRAHRRAAQRHHRDRAPALDRPAVRPRAPVQGAADAGGAGPQARPRVPPGRASGAVSAPGDTRALPARRAGGHAAGVTWSSISRWSAACRATCGAC